MHSKGKAEVDSLNKRHKLGVEKLEAEFESERKAVKVQMEVLQERLRQSQEGYRTLIGECAGLER